MIGVVGRGSGRDQRVSSQLCVTRGVRNRSLWKLFVRYTAGDDFPSVNLQRQREKGRFVTFKMDLLEM